MTRVVIDTSVLIKWLSKTDEEDIHEADLLLKMFLDGEYEVFVPELVKYETGNVLLKRKKIEDYEIATHMRAFYSFPLIFVPETEELAVVTFTIAKKLGITYYDASFIALAKEYRAILVTQNVKHQMGLVGVEVLSLKELQGG